MDHEVPAGEVNMTASLSDGPVDETPVESTEPVEYTAVGLLEEVVSSVAMLGMTLLATGKFDEANGIELALDFLTFFAKEQGFTSPLLEQLYAAREGRQTESVPEAGSDAERSAAREAVLDLLGR